MSVFYVDLTEADSKESLYSILKKTLPLPEECGRNLDALYDVFTGCGQDWNIIFYNEAKLQTAMPDYLDRMKKMAADAAAACVGLQIRFYP